MELRQDFGATKQMAIGLGVVLLIVYGVNPGWGVLLVPVWVLLFTLTGLGIGLAASAWMVRYRDVAYVLPWIMQVALFATPVAYSLDAVLGLTAWWTPQMTVLALAAGAVGSFGSLMMRRPAPAVQGA